MNDERDLRQALAFERWWDRLIRGRAVGRDPDLDPGLEAFARRVHAPDERPAADPAFKRRLWEDLMAAHPRTAVLPGSSIGLNGPVRRIPAPAPRPVASPRPVHRRVTAALSIATTAVLVAAVLALVVFVFRDDQNVAVPPRPASPTPVATPATPEAPSYPMWGGNPARDRHLPGPAPQGEPFLLWQYPAEGAASFGTLDNSGVLADGVLYATGSSGVVAVEAATGRELWRAPRQSGHPVIDGDGLILRSSVPTAFGSDLVRINRSDGGLVWTAETGKLGSEWSPVVADGVGYVPSSGDLVAFDPATGAVLWRVPLHAPASRGASVADGLVVLGDQTGTVYGISTAGGAVVWTQQIEATTIGHPSIVDGAVYFTAFGSGPAAYYALDLATGAVRWRFLPPDGVGFITGAVDATTVYAPNNNGGVYAIDTATGTLRWRFETGAVGKSPTIVGETLFVAAGDGFLYAIEAATGAERWRFPLDGAAGIDPIVVDGVIYVATWPGTIYAIGGSASSGGGGGTSDRAAVGPTAEATPMP